MLVVLDVKHLGEKKNILAPSLACLRSPDLITCPGADATPVICASLGPFDVIAVVNPFWFFSSCSPMLGGFPGGSDGKEFVCSVGDLGSSLDLADPLEEGMAAHSSILAWRIPGAEDPGGLWSTGSQRIRHD